ncbi:phospholipase D-like domain-containing protein [Sphingomonas sp.]|uniref:phospholipase D-like domain-containing protein n=1 Tax=Sphingomonas sp. TaxID=28214 RepID=UPI003B00C756
MAERERIAAEVEGNRLTLLTEGPEQLDALIATIDDARTSLRLLYYTLADDASGRRVRDAAVAACRRGVDVALIVDGFGSDLGDDFLKPLEEAGASACRFSPRVGRRYLLRNHQKLALADEMRALIGGFNVEDDYFAEGDRGWRDLGLIVEGPAACHLAGYFDALTEWAGRPAGRIRDLNRLIVDKSQDEGRLRWLLGGPTRRLSPWANALRADIKRGRRGDIVAAYFAPSLGVLRRIGRLARGGDVRIVTAAKSDNETTIAAARHTYPRLLRHGARVFEYQPGKLHTKLFVIDDATYLGSANCDMRSLFLNLEIMLRIEDAGFADRMRAYIDGEIARSREATRERLRKAAGPVTRARWSAAYFLVAVVDFSVTRRLNLPSGSDEIAG